MKELSLNILDISENSVKARATLVEITLTETDETLTVSVKDDGCGMDGETLKSVENPFYTTRTTRSVGLGIPLLKMAAEQTGGEVKISSTVDDGTGGDAQEYVMLALRLSKGLSIKEFENKFGRLPNKFINRVRSFKGFCTVDGENIRLTDEGMLISNAIISELIEVL